MPLGGAPYSPFSGGLSSLGGSLGGGIMDFYRRLQQPSLGASRMYSPPSGFGGGFGGAGGVPTGTASPRAVPSPPNAPITPGFTKESMGLTPPPASTPGAGWQGIPYRLPGVAPEPAPEETSYLRYSTPTSGGFQDYDPTADRGIEAFAGGSFMGAEGTPGGGGYAPSQQDWSKVANPMAFEAYTDPLRQAAMEAERKRLEMAAADPLWEERGKADIWRQTQFGLQKGIQDMLRDDYQRRAQRIQDDVNREFPGHSPEQKMAVIRERLENLEAENATLFGNRGAASGVRSYGGYPG